MLTTYVVNKMNAPYYSSFFFLQFGTKRFREAVTVLESNETKVTYFKTWLSRSMWPVSLWKGFFWCTSMNISLPKLDVFQYQKTKVWLLLFWFLVHCYTAICYKNHLTHSISMTCKVTSKSSQDSLRTKEAIIYFCNKAIITNSSLNTVAWILESIFFQVRIFNLTFNYALF